MTSAALCAWRSARISSGLIRFITGREFGEYVPVRRRFVLRRHQAMPRKGRTSFLRELWCGATRCEVAYTPRDEQEVTECQSLFWVSYNFALVARGGDSSE